MVRMAIYDGEHLILFEEGYQGSDLQLIIIIASIFGVFVIAVIVFSIFSKKKGITFIDVITCKVCRKKETDENLLSKIDLLKEDVDI